MVIKTFDPVTLSEKETTTKVTSVIRNRRFYKTGSFQIETTADIFKVGDVIAYKCGDEICSGIIMQLVEDEKGIISLSGYDLKCVFDFRYITTPESYTGTPEEIIKSLAADYLTEGDRTIPNLVISPLIGGGTSVTFTPEADFLSTAIQSFCLSHEIGVFIDFDLTNINLRTVIGTDRSDTVRFGRKYRNIESMKYTSDIFNTYNVGYSIDEEGAETVSGTASGLLRRECFKDKNIDEYLKEKAEVENLRAEATGKYIYGRDYFLGDYVSVYHKNAFTKMQITEIKEIHERSNTVIIPVFGTEKENPLQKILKGAR